MFIFDKDFSLTFYNCQENFSCAKWSDFNSIWYREFMWLYWNTVNSVINPTLINCQDLQHVLYDIKYQLGSHLRFTGKC